ncbi:uncharacterized protein LOC106363938 [Brassica napus]|uniref:uncharacterized protein LOC106363938 n=1 Tax=Brassica napus TaxID=3708 RepID=UPI0006AAC1AA|nr:uncharacterized protein LOC106363938 [Brassica napus]
MNIALKVNKVWDDVDPGSKAEEKNDLAIALIFQYVPEALILQVGDLDTTKAIWEAIKARHVGAERVREARLKILMAEFDRLKMKDEDTIDVFVGKLSEISSKSASLGEIIEESKIVKKFLKSLPRRKYIHIVASLEQVLDLNTTSFEEIVGRLKSYEERIGEDEEELQDDKSKLLFSNTESQQDHYGGNRGRGRGGRNNSWRDVAVAELLKLQETTEKKDEDTQEADELMMHEVFYLNEKKVNPTMFDSDHDTQNLWYLDNGASNHMSGNRTFFYELDENITCKVRFGDDSHIDIKGKRSIRFLFPGGSKKVLRDVYYIPALRSNIVSLGQATEAGCEVRMKDDALMPFDREGRLMVESTRSRNRLYKVMLEADRRKKLDDRSRTLVHLGTEPGSKAYRLVDSISKKIIVNRDVVFDKTKSWNWDKEIPRQKMNSDTFTIRVKGLDDNEAIETQVANENEGTVQTDEVEEESDSETEENLILIPDIESHNQSLNKKSFSYSITQTHKSQISNHKS